MANVYRKKKGEMVGVDIGSTSIKVVKLSQVGRNVRIDGYAIVPLIPGSVSDDNLDSSEVIKKLKQAIKLLGLKPKTLAAFSLPMSSIVTADEVFSKDLTDFEIEQQIINNISKYTTFQREQAYFDFSITEKDTEQDIHIVAARNDVLDSKANLLQEAGLIPKVATLDNYAMDKVLSFVLANKDTSSKPIAIFDIGASLTTFFFIKNGAISEADTTEFGGHNLIDAIAAKYNCSVEDAEDIAENGTDEDDDYYDKILKPFMEEAHQAIEKLIRMSDEDDTGAYAEIIISGGTANTHSLIEFLNDHIDTRVSKINPFASIIISPNLNEQKVRHDAPVLVTAFGLALHSFLPSLNLMPWREDLVRDQKRTYLTGAALAALLGCGLTFGFWSYYNNDLNNNISANGLVESRTAQVDTKLEELKDIGLKREQMITRMELIQGLQSQRSVVVSILNSVVDQMPNQAFLIGLSKDDETFTFTGKASDAPVVAEFMRSLKKTGWFNNIFMSSYISHTENPNEQKAASILREEDKYGSFIVTADLLKKQDEKALTQDVIVVRETATTDLTQRGEDKPAEALPINTAPTTPATDQQQNGQAIVNGGDHVQN